MIAYIQRISPPVLPHYPNPVVSSTPNVTTNPPGPVAILPIVSTIQSPISGLAVQPSIFMPSQTTANILAQGQMQTNYQEPQPAFDLSSVHPIALSAPIVPPAQPSEFLGLDSNTILILLILAALLIAVVL